PGDPAARRWPVASRAMPCPGPSITVRRKRRPSGSGKRSWESTRVVEPPASPSVPARSSSIVLLGVLLGVLSGPRAMLPAYRRHVAGSATRVTGAVTRSVNLEEGKPSRHRIVVVTTRIEQFHPSRRRIIQNGPKCIVKPEKQGNLRGPGLGIRKPQNA